MITFKKFLSLKNMFNFKKSFNPKEYSTDKMGSYFPVYQQHFSELRNKPIKLFELGIYKGESLRLWADYFRKSIIVGLDMNHIEIPDKKNIYIYQGLQQDKKLLKKISNKHAPKGFDIIIDDASHIGEYTKESFKILFKNYLKKGGVYVIEDWGTGYWSTWPDGKKYDKKLSEQSLNSHQAGMVGFVKQIIDQLAFNDINKDKNHTGKNISNLNIKSIEYFPGLCFVYKK